MNSPEWNPLLLKDGSAASSVSREPSDPLSSRASLDVGNALASALNGSAGAWFTPGRFALMLALLVGGGFPPVTLGLKTFVHRDFGLFGYPLAFFHHQCFWRGELPLWNPYNNAGLPFLAQW